MVGGKEGRREGRRERRSERSRRDRGCQEQKDVRDGGKRQRGKRDTQSPPTFAGIRSLPHSSGLAPPQPTAKAKHSPHTHRILRQAPASSLLPPPLPLTMRWSALASGPLHCSSEPPSSLDPNPPLQSQLRAQKFRLHLQRFRLPRFPLVGAERDGTGMGGGKRGQGSSTKAGGMVSGFEKRAEK